MARWAPPANAESNLLLAQASARLGPEAPAREFLAEIAATPWRSPEVRELAKRLARRPGRGSREP